MNQAFLALLGALLTSAACYSTGTLLVDGLNLKLRRTERLPLAFLTGAACLHLAVFSVLALHIAYWPVLVALVLAPVAAAIATGSWRLRGEPDQPVPPNLKWFSILLFGIFSLLYFFHAWAPESSPDGASYHLGFVSQYMRAHGFVPFVNMYAALSQGLELLFLPAFVIGRHSAAALVHYSFLIALALAIFAFGRQLGKPWAGATAAFLVYASPVVGIDATSAYNDLAVAAVVFGVFYWLEIWDREHDDRALIPVGLLAGYAYAVKYTAFVMVIFALGFVLFRARRLRPALSVAGLAALMIVPWVVRDWIVYQDPIAPFGDRIFRSPYFTPLFEQQYEAYMRRYGVANLWSLPLEATIRGQKTEGLIGPVFLAAPIALLALRYRAGRRLLAAGALLLATYFANVGTRFLIPALPFFGLAVMLPLENLAWVPAVIMIFHGLASWPGYIHYYSDQFVWQLEPRILYKQALRKIPQDRYLRETYSPYSVARMVEYYVPKGERVLGIGAGVADSYTTHEVMESYESAFNQTLVDFINTGSISEYQPRVLEDFKFPMRSARRVRIVQTVLGNPDEQWSVHEVRFLYRGAELPRREGWRLRAWPNPWQVQLAFDNSPATRWRTWERAAPGDYLDVDFGAAQQIDEVRVERSWDYNNLHIQAEVLDENGMWRTLADHPQVTDLSVDPNIRLAATRELSLRGIHYLLIQDNQAGADDIRDDPEGWGLQAVAAEGTARLYRVMQ